MILLLAISRVPNYLHSTEWIDQRLAKFEFTVVISSKPMRIWTECWPIHESWQPDHTITRRSTVSQSPHTTKSRTYLVRKCGSLFHSWSSRLFVYRRRWMRGPVGWRSVSVGRCDWPSRRQLTAIRTTRTCHAVKQNQRISHTGPRKREVCV